MNKHNKPYQHHNPQPHNDKPFSKVPGIQLASIEIDDDVVRVPREEYDDLIASEATLDIIGCMLSTMRYVGDDTIRAILGIKEPPREKSPAGTEGNVIEDE